MVNVSPVSVVVLTKDEAANVAECLEGVLAQLREGDEVVVIDAASRDGTLAVVERCAASHPGRVRAQASPTALTFGAARNVGVEMARHDVIVFVSADAVPEPSWLDELRAAAENADVVYGRQKHAPTVQNVASVSRGLRYRHFEEKATALPETYASNVNAAYRRYAFKTLQFDDKAAGAEDVAFAKAARLAGLRLAYAPRAIVRHKDAATWKAEIRKHQREGEAYAQLGRLLGAPTWHFAWALTVGVSGILATLLASWILLACTLVAFFAPTLRRLASPAARSYRLPKLVGAAAVSPFFDLIFVGSYVKRRWIA